MLRANDFETGSRVEEVRLSLIGQRSLHQGTVVWGDQGRNLVWVRFDENQIGAMVGVHPSKLRRLSW